MATTGTYSFAPSAADLILNAYGMIGVRRPEITQQHMQDAYLQANLLMVDFANRSPNRWTMETTSQLLTSGAASYSLPPQILSIAIAYIDTTSGGVTTSRVLGPISATDYAAIPNKNQLALPTSYFFSLLTTPTITLWPTPDDAQTYTLRMQTFRQTQDVAIAGGVNIETPYRFLDAFTTGLAARLAVIYPPKDPNATDRINKLFNDRFTLAAQADQEKTPMYVRPSFAGYYR